MGGRKVHPPAKMPHTRPTTDIAKEGLFNILQNNLDFESLKTLDLFGGTGSISYELASRGATDQTIVEKDPAMFAFIQKTVESFGLQHVKVIKMDVFKYLESCQDKFDFIFAGPPYALETIDELPRIIIERGLLKPGGMFVLEHTPRNNYEGFEKFVSERNYGTTLFSFFINR
ncbi:RsmD family RNA methyltransferase [Flavihumibacter profundi]|uniref:RsmD family RNA methyltransferase n=1 Tax=Flavihumibacter profundi TaxID=2716883 RepID=UPI0021D41BBB|nr:RsmD family RNA methyltransferase [Flavihumibacter profundi]